MRKGFPDNQLPMLRGGEAEKRNSKGKFNTASGAGEIKAPPSESGCCDLAFRYSAVSITVVV